MPITVLNDHLIVDEQPRVVIGTGPERMGASLGDAYLAVPFDRVGAADGPVPGVLGFERDVVDDLLLDRLAPKLQPGVDASQEALTRSRHAG
jgi:hypothetical protein